MEIINQMRALLAKAGEFPRLEPVVSQGKTYVCPMCDGNGDIEDERVKEGQVTHGTGVDFSIVGIQAYGFGDGYAAMEELMPLAINNLPALLDIAEAADQWSRATDYDSQAAHLARLRRALRMAPNAQDDRARSAPVDPLVGQTPYNTEIEP